MQIFDTCTLISEAPSAHGAFDTTAASNHEVFCSISAVSMNETYQALSLGIRPQFRIRLFHEFEYNGEQKVKFRDVIYDVLRTYTTEEDGIELTVYRKNSYDEGSVPGHA